MKDITLDIISLINLFGFFLGILFVLIILRFKKGKSQHKKILAALIFSLCTIILTSFLWTSDGYYLYPHLFKILPLFYLVIGPLLYLYIKSLTKEEFKLNPRYFLHFIPFVLNIIFYLPYYLKPAEDKLLYIESFFSSQTLNIQAYEFMLFRLVHLLIYLLIGFRLIYRYHRDVKNVYSSYQETKLSWMTILVVVFTTVFVNYLLYFLVRFWGENIFNDVCKWLSIWETMLIIFLSYKSLTQPDVIQIDPKNNKSKQIKLSLDETNTYLQTIKKHMKKNKPYLDSFLTIRELSTQISLPYWTISQIINEHLGKNFFEFVNEYRIEEAKKLIRDSGDEKNMVEIAYSSGFNSKSAFNAAFKRMTQQTPSQYKKSQKKLS